MRLSAESRRFARLEHFVAKYRAVFGKADHDGQRSAEAFRVSYLDGCAFLTVQHLLLSLFLLLNFECFDGGSGDAVDVAKCCAGNDCDACQHESHVVPSRFKLLHFFSSFLTTSPKRVGLQ